MATDLKTWITETGPMAGYLRLAERCGVKWQTVQYWARVNRVPAKYLAAAEAETGVPRERLNPLPFLSVYSGIRDLNAAINLRNYAVSSTVSACGEEGSDLGRTLKTKPASAKQESSAKPGMSRFG